jgi:hypothetical protein
MGDERFAESWRHALCHQWGRLWGNYPRNPHPASDTTGLNLWEMSVRSRSRGMGLRRGRGPGGKWVVEVGDSLYDEEDCDLWYQRRRSPQAQKI